MRVKITADGSARGTRVTDASGKPVEGVTEVSFRHQATGVPEVTLGICMPIGEIEGEARIYGPNGKMIKKIVYDDGTESVY